MKTIVVCLYILIVAVLMLLPQSNLHSQFLPEYAFPDYETLEWLYETGQIDQDEFDRWSELFLDSLTQTTGGMDSSITVTRPRPAAHRIDYEAYQRGDEQNPYRQLIRLRSAQNINIYGDMTAEKLNDGSFAFRNRIVGWFDGMSKVELGGVDPLWCGGLVAGRHNIFLKKNDRSETVLYPLKSRFNGLLAQTVRGNLSIAALASYDQGDEFSSAAFGGDVVYRIEKSSIEASLLRGRIKNTGNSRTAKTIAFGAGANIIRKNSFTANLYTSLDGDGDGAFMFGLFSAKRQHSVRIWHYGKHYTNPFGAGRANPDTRPVEIDEIDLEFRSRYADETGIQTRSRFPFSVHSLLVESNWWRSGETGKYRIKLTHTLKINNNHRLKLTLLSGDDDLKRTGFELYSAHLKYRHTGLSFGNLTLAGRVRSKGNTNGDRISYSVESRIDTKGSDYHSSLLLRWYDPDTLKDRDHYLYGYIKESFVLDDSIWFSLLISSRFGPAQNTIEKTRLTLKTEWWF